MEGRPIVSDCQGGVWQSFVTQWDGLITCLAPKSRPSNRDSKVRESSLTVNYNKETKESPCKTLHEKESLLKYPREIKESLRLDSTGSLKPRITLGALRRGREKRHREFTGKKPARRKDV